MPAEKTLDFIHKMSSATATHKRKTPCNIDLTKSPPDSPPDSPSTSQCSDVGGVPFYLFIKDSSESSELVHYIADIADEDNKESYVYQRLMQLYKEKKSHFPYVTDEEFVGLIRDVPKVPSTKTPKAVDKKAVDKRPSTSAYNCQKTVKKMKLGQRPVKNGGKSDCINDSEEENSEEDEEDDKEDKDNSKEDEDEDNNEKDKDEHDEDDNDEMTEQDQIEAFGDFMQRKMVQWNRWPRPGVPISALQHIKWMVNFSSS